MGSSIWLACLAAWVQGGEAQGGANLDIHLGDGDAFKLGEQRCLCIAHHVVHELRQRALDPPLAFGVAGQNLWVDRHGFVRLAEVDHLRITCEHAAATRASPRFDKAGTLQLGEHSTLTAMLADENGLAVISTTQADGRILSSVTNCGVIKHPANGEAQVAFVSIGSAARLGHIRRGAPVTVTIRRGWTWLSVTGQAELIGPEQQPDGFDDDALRRLLREVFHAAGGTHDDLNEYDQAMAEEGRVAVLVAPERILGNS